MRPVIGIGHIDGADPVQVFYKEVTFIENMVTYIRHLIEK
jgi:hypothetical protein